MAKERLSNRSELPDIIAYDFSRWFFSPLVVFLRNIELFCELDQYAEHKFDCSIGKSNSIKRTVMDKGRVVVARDREGNVVGMIKSKEVKFKEVNQGNQNGTLVEAFACDKTNFALLPHILALELLNDLETENIILGVEREGKRAKALERLYRMFGFRRADLGLKGRDQKYYRGEDSFFTTMIGEKEEVLRRISSQIEAN